MFWQRQSLRKVPSALPQLPGFYRGGLPVKQACLWCQHWGKSGPKANTTGQTGSQVEAQPGLRGSSNKWSEQEYQYPWRHRLALPEQLPGELVLREQNMSYGSLWPLIRGNSRGWGQCHPKAKSDNNIPNKFTYCLGQKKGKKNSVWWEK